MFAPRSLHLLSRLTQLWCQHVRTAISLFVESFGSAVVPTSLHRYVSKSQAQQVLHRALLTFPGSTGSAMVPTGSRYDLTSLLRLDRFSHSCRQVRKAITLTSEDRFSSDGLHFSSLVFGGGLEYYTFKASDVVPLARPSNTRTSV